jgi:hypothetical protein
MRVSDAPSKKSHQESPKPINESLVTRYPIPISKMSISIWYINHIDMVDNHIDTSYPISILTLSLTLSLRH